MLAHHPEIVLYQPEIPQNTGNIARLAAATGCRLHLIRPLGFSTEDKNLRRPGLDYWPFLDLEIHDQLPEPKEPEPEPKEPEPKEPQPQPKMALFTKFATKPYTAMPKDTRMIVFGRETTGLPEDLRKQHQDHCYAIPMFHSGVRSLNLANAVAIVVYHLLAQHYAGFNGRLPEAGPPL